MQTIIYILAAIGGLSVFSVIVLLILIALTSTNPEEKEETTCILTGEHCIYVNERRTCSGCPIAEEAEKIGDR